MHSRVLSGSRARGLLAISGVTTLIVLTTSLGGYVPRAAASGSVSEVTVATDDELVGQILNREGDGVQARSMVSRTAPTCDVSVDDSVSLKAAVEQSVDDSIICITADIPDLTAELVIDDTTLTLVGAGGDGDDSVTLTADDTRHVMATLADDSLVIDNLGFEGGFSDQSGGAIAVYGQSASTFSSVIVERSTFSGNSAGVGGALAVFDVSEVQVTDSRFSSNFAVYGGAVAVDVEDAESRTIISGSTFTDDSALIGGGAIALRSTRGWLQTIIVGQIGSPTTFTGHSAAQGGALWAQERGPEAGPMLGIAGEVLFKDNEAEATGDADGYGGAAYVATDDTVTQDGFPSLLILGGENVDTIFSGQPAFHGNTAVSGGAIAVTGLAFVGAVPDGSEESDPEEFTGADFTANVANPGSGGAIWVDGAVAVQRTSFASNTARVNGGAIALDDTPGTPAEIEAAVSFYSLFTHNSATTGRGGAISVASGEGIAGAVSTTFVANYGHQSGGAIDTTDSQVLLENSTVAYNWTDDSAGAIHAPNATASVSFSTIVGNEGGSGGGGVVVSDLTVANSILQGNTADLIDQDVQATTVNDSYSLFTGITSVLVSGWTPGPGVLLSSENVLGPLQDNGGVTVDDDTVIPTMKPLTGSAVINAANPDETNFPSVDERGPGFPRVVGTRADMGAIEGTPPTPDPTPWPPRPPGPVETPPSAPLNVLASAGDAAAQVSWSPPESSGTSPVTEYQVQAAPGDAMCTAVAPTLTCTVTGLANGTAYTFTVRARSAVGWGSYSLPSQPITPETPVVATITIVGSRGEVRGRPGVLVSGSTAGLAGREVTAWVRLAGQSAYVSGATRMVDAEGAFTWQRVTGKKTYVYFTASDIRSNRVIIPPAPRA